MNLKDQVEKEQTDKIEITNSFICRQIKAGCQFSVEGFFLATEMEHLEKTGKWHIFKFKDYEDKVIKNLILNFAEKQSLLKIINDPANIYYEHEEENSPNPDNHRIIGTISNITLSENKEFVDALYNFSACPDYIWNDLNNFFEKYGHLDVSVELCPKIVNFKYYSFSEHPAINGIQPIYATPSAVPITGLAVAARGKCNHHDGCGLVKSVNKRMINMSENVPAATSIPAGTVQPDTKVVETVAKETPVPAGYGYSNKEVQDLVSTQVGQVNSKIDKLVESLGPLFSSLQQKTAPVVESPKNTVPEFTSEQKARLDMADKLIKESAVKEAAYKQSMVNTIAKSNLFSFSEGELNGFSFDRLTGLMDAVKNVEKFNVVKPEVPKSTPAPTPAPEAKKAPANMVNFSERKGVQFQEGAKGLYRVEIDGITVNSFNFAEMDPNFVRTLYKDDPTMLNSLILDLEDVKKLTQKKQKDWTEGKDYSLIELPSDTKDGEAK